MGTRAPSRIREARCCAVVEPVVLNPCEWLWRQSMERHILEGFYFNDSPELISLEQMVERTEPGDCVQEIRTLALETTDDKPNMRLVCFKDAGNGVKDLKTFVKDLKANGIPLGEEFVKFVKDSYEAWQVLAATDIWESLLLRLNFYFDDVVFLANLDRFGLAFGPFARKLETLSYTGLFLEERRFASRQEPEARDGVYWCSWAREFAEEKYLAEMNQMGYAGFSQDSLRKELETYLTVTKKLSQRNEVAHSFSSGMKQISHGHGQGKVRVLLDEASSSMHSDLRDDLLRKLGDLIVDVPSCFKDQRALIMQIRFLQTAFNRWNIGPMPYVPRPPRG